MIKILYIVPNLYNNSGVTRVVSNYVTHFNSNNICIDFLVLEKNDNFNTSLSIYANNIFYLNNSFKNIFKLRKEIKSFFINHKYDIVELHAPNYSFLFLKEALNAGITNRIVHAHSSTKSLNKIKNIIWTILNVNLKKYANYYFACSTLSFDYWFGHDLLDLNRGFVIPNGEDKKIYFFDPKKRTIIRNKLCDSNEFIIGYVGRVTSEKNLNFLIDVYKEINSKNTKLVFVGEISSKKIKEKCKVISKNIIFMGYQKNVADYYCSFDLLVLPSKREGLPTSVIEAQMCGLSCIISNTITSEVDIGAVTFLPLNKQIWKEEINKHISDFTKNNNCKVLDNSIDFSKFEIINCTRNLEKIYSTIMEGDKK